MKGTTQIPVLTVAGLVVAANHPGVLYVAVGAAALILVVLTSTAGLSRRRYRRNGSLAVLNVVRRRRPDGRRPAARCGRRST